MQFLLIIEEKIFPVAGRLLVAKVNLLMFVEESSWVIRRIAIVQVKTSLSLDSSDVNSDVFRIILRLGRSSRP